MDHHTFDLLVGQMQDLKRDIQQAKDDIMEGLKSRDNYYNQVRLDTNEHLAQHDSHIDDLRRSKWYSLGAVGVLLLIVEVGFRAFDYYLLHSKL